MVDCDVVVFKNPALECSVFVTNVPNSVDEEHLFNVFGRCGLVYDVHKFTPESLKRKANENVPTTCAAIKYYTRAEARRAIAELNQYTLEGMPIRVVPSNMKENRTVALSFPKSVDVCNYFLGFHKWSTRVIAMRKVLNEEEENKLNSEANKEIKEESNPVDASATNPNENKFGESEKDQEADYKNRPAVQIEFECQIELTLGGKKAIGVGIGKHSGRYPPKVYEIARKLSITNARKNAFSKCAIMVLNTGKVDVHVNEEEKTEEEEEIKPEDILKGWGVCTIENLEKGIV
eukprot:Phypoly_transcript_13109.p1 GENE.Phypoly_transcript_13109~~Phypoly_transcript_13109.p1  ORF type:complete len:291 (+),score=66.57 Phypoly_transcript_13109:54-926(+)